MSLNNESETHSQPRIGTVFVFGFDLTISGKNIQSILVEALDFAVAKKMGIEVESAFIPMENIEIDENSQLTAKEREDVIEETWNESIKYIKPRTQTGNISEWNELFSTLINDGHDISIASFNAFPEILQRYMQEVLKIRPEILEKIFFNIWEPEPEPSEKYNKNEHIQQALDHFRHVLPSERQVVLIDDSERILEAADEKNLLLNKEKHPLDPEHPFLSKKVSEGFVWARNQEANEMADCLDPEDPELFTTGKHLAVVLDLSKKLKPRIRY